MRKKFALKPFWMLLTATFISVSPFEVQAQEGTCAPAKADKIERQLDAALEQIQLVDYASALAELEKAEQMLPCASEVLGGQLLARIQLLRGLAMFYLGNPDGTKNAFLRALVFDPMIRWDNSFGQRPREVFLDAKESSLTRGTVQVKCPLLNDGVKIYVNGKVAIPGQSMPLQLGTHFVQVSLPNGVWESSFFDVTPSREELLIPRKALKGESVTTRPTEPTRPDRTPPRNPPPARPPQKSSPLDPMIPLVASGGVAGVGLTGALLFGLSFQRSKSELEALNLTEADFVFDEAGNITGFQDPEHQQLYNSHVRASVGTNVSLAVTAVGIGSTVFFYLQRPKDGHASTLVTPVITPTAVGLAVHGAF